MRKINKYTDDLLIGLEMECYSGYFNIEAFEKINFRIYTLDSTNYIEQTFDKNQSPKFINIIQSGDQYCLKFEQNDLEKLDNGQLRCFYQYSLLHSDFTDGTYDASDYLPIEGFITDGTEKINIISKGGCC